MANPSSGAHRWSRIESLFNEAMELPPGEARGFLQSACADDPELLREVESLMAAEAAANGGEYFGHVVGNAARTVHRVEALQEGDRVGRYRVVREIGSGGMGSVYLALRDDEEYNKQVAIKVVKRGMDTASILRRFRHERQILAGLEHPNIARLLDGGTTEDGRPYLVMEYVEGEALTTYCRSRKLGIPHRLQLFRHVCSAVEHAHRNLIVHRDLKPGNILVTNEGVPKLLDFGIAKLLDETGSQATVAMTAAGRMLTPDYASPEQVRGEPISTATDIYSLGAVLFELLTGERPHRITTTSAVEIERAVCEIDIPRPSLVAARTSRFLARRVEGDLDNIIQMAMRKEPQRRYGTVEQFSDDIRRHLEALPVSARQDTTLYRTSKFIRRNRGPVAAAAIIALSLIAGAVAAGIQARRAEEEARKANRRFQQVRQLAGVFLFEFERRIRHLAGSTDAREFVAATAAQYLDSLAQDAEGDLGLQQELARAYESVGEIRGHPGLPSLGHRKQAFELYEKALVLRRKIFAARRDDAEAAAAVVRPLADMCGILGEQGELARALEYCKEARAVAKAFVAAHPQHARHPVFAYGVQRQLGDINLRQRNLREALANYEEYLVAANEALQRAPTPAAEEAVAAGETKLGETLHEMERSAEAYPHHVRSIAVYEKLLAEKPDDARLKRSVLRVNLAAGDAIGRPFDSQPGDLNKARIHYTGARKSAEQLYEKDPNNTQALVDLVSLLRREGASYKMSEPSAGIPFLRRALELSKVLVARAPGNTLYMQQQGFASSNLAMMLFASGQMEAAIEQRRKTIEIQTALHRTAPDSTRYFVDLQGSISILASYLEKAGRPAEAEREYRTAIARDREALLKWPDREGVVEDYIWSLNDLARFLFKGTPGSVEGCGLLRERVELLARRSEKNPADAAYKKRHGAAVERMQAACPAGRR